MAQATYSGFEGIDNNFACARTYKSVHPRCGEAPAPALCFARCYAFCVACEEQCLQRSRDMCICSREKAVIWTLGSRQDVIMLWKDVWIQPDAVSPLLKKRGLYCLEDSSVGVVVGVVRSVPHPCQNVRTVIYMLMILITCMPMRMGKLAFPRILSPLGDCKCSIMYMQEVRVPVA